jgi:uncharacterized protein (DUF362 family)
MQLNNTSVALLAQPTYQQPQLDRAVERVLATVGGLGTLRTAKVLLKPNLITASNGQLACTDARFIAAVARWFLAQGARVAVGDSPSFGSARSVLTAIGARADLQALGVGVVEFKQTRETLLACGQKAALATAALDCDLLVNLPRIKAHSQMRVTLAVKNYFGCLAGFHKPWWHMAHGGANGQFASLLVELLAVLPPSLSLVDGIVAMHRTGPIHGEPYPLGLMAAGTNPVAIDTALLSLLGIEPSHCPLWQAAFRAGIIGAAREELAFPLATSVALRVHDFITPLELGPIRFNPFRFWKNSIKRVALRVWGECR